MNIYVLIACEESQTETKVFRQYGCEAYSCDLQRCGRFANPSWHIQGDVTPLLEGKRDFVTADGERHKVPRWDLIIAHPPCTYLCRRSGYFLQLNPDYYYEWEHGQKWVNRDRLGKLLDGRDFFFKCMSAQAPFVAVENPVPLSIAQLPRPSTYVEPFWYGEPWSKKTCLWLKNLPPLMPTVINPDVKSYVRSSRGKWRSRGFKGIAEAMASQWLPVVADSINLNIF